MATAKSPCPLDKFLTDQKWVNARCLANQAMQAHEQRKVEPTTEASTESLPPPESPRTRQIRLLKEELAEIIDRSVFMVIRETVEKIYARTKRLDDILEDGPHTTRKYHFGALISQKHILDRIRKLWEDHAAYEPEPAKVKQDALTWWWKHKASLKETGQKTGNEGGIMDSYWAGPVEDFDYEAASDAYEPKSVPDPNYNTWAKIKADIEKLLKSGMSTTAAPPPEFDTEDEKFAMSES
ncbi:hypothetical protein LZ32DRAFT_660564 [Colletotrichum eremochloae]|nr:hypothetical protein LZ32DRAFT_660564 [Colletotrichum eremochloae]